MSPPFLKTSDVPYGEVRQVTGLVRRVVARNPSAFTFHGTGTYIVGRGRVAVIDPGPDDPAHVAALLEAVRGETVSHILITHTHRDHSPAAAALQAQTGAPTFAFGPHPVPPGDGGVEEGGDHGFRPDHLLAEGDCVTGQGWSLTALHTPGHISNHLCFALAEEEALFSGDHVMGWSTTVISPPDGNMAAYFASLRKLLPRTERVFYPTHGAPISEATNGVAPAAFVQALIRHREARETQILAALAAGDRRISEMVARLYADVPVYLHPAAARSVLAHLVHMVSDGRVAADPQPSEEAIYYLP